jgi:hypothetical protein
VWFVGALVFVMQMMAAPPSGLKRSAVGLLITWGLWLVLFIVVMSLTGVLGDYYSLAIVPAVMVPILFILMIAFIIVADLAFRAAHGPVNGDLSDMRSLRGVHLGLNLSGMFIFPIFTFIGVPLTLAKIARHRRTSRSFGWAAAFGVLTLLFVAIVMLLAIITASIPSNYDDYRSSFCRKRALLQADTTTIGTTGAMPADTTTSTTFATTSFPSSFVTTLPGGESSLTASPALPTSTVWGTLAWDTTDLWGTTDWWGRQSTVDFFTGTTYTGCALEGQGAGSVWSGLGSKIWADPYYYYYYRTQLDEPGVVTAVVVLSLLAWIFHIVFTVLADQIILKHMVDTPGAGPITGVVISQVPGVATSQPLVHPCASCGTPLQFNRTGPTTQVQCYQCRAIVEFTTA